MNKSIVLLSSGLDSTVNLFLAHQKTQVVKVLTFDYGQKAASKEIKHSEKMARKLHLPHEVIALPWLKNISTSSLTQVQRQIPLGNEVSIDHLETSQKTARSVWVPNRNGVFLNIAAAYADALSAECVIPGFNLEEAQTFPDNSDFFLKITAEAFRFSTRNEVQVLCYTTQMRKTEIMKLAIQEKIPFDLMWPCYLDGDKWCGQCESCLRTQRAMFENNFDFKPYFN